MKKLFIIIALTVSALNPNLVYAQPTNAPGSDLPQYNAGVDDTITEYLCTPSEKPDGRDLERCINRLFRFGITAGALVLVFFVVWAGYMYITSGESGKTKGKQMLINSLVGMFVLLGGYTLLYFINPSLVTFKPIQPPIFDAQDLPSCEDIGFGQSCTIEGDEDVAIAKTGGGSAINCPSGLVAYDKSVPANSNPSSVQICSTLMQKLKTLHAKHKIIVTSTIRDGNTQSLCHKSNNGKSGACADIASSAGDWDGLCKAIKEVGGLGFLNESGQDSANCGKFVKTKYWSGAHLHVNLVGG